MSRPIKRRKISPPSSEQESDAASTDFTSDSEGDWDLEEAYARKSQQAKKPESTRLPVRTAEGWVAPVVVQEEVDEMPEISDNDDEADEAEQDGEEESEPQLSPREQIVQAKEQLAKCASLVTEDPEENISALKDMAELAASKNMVVKKLALVSQCAVFRDIIPGYRIRPVSEDEMKEKLSKDVKRLRNYEQGLVRSYQRYVSHLDQLTKRRNADDGAGVYSVALSCACTMLTERPGFNFRSNLLGIVVRRLSINTVDADFTKCANAIEHLYREDDEGHSSLDAVNAMTKMMKARNYNVNELALNTFLHLRLLSEFAGKASQHKVDKNLDDVRPLGKKKEVKEFRNKKQRKHLKELKKVEKELKEADATVGKEENDRMQAEMLKMVFATYFRILKARSPKLMGATLEGLARYAHLINQDFFGDILEALKDLLRSPEQAEDDGLGDQEEDETVDTGPSRDLLRESLLCVITAFALLQGQDGRTAGSTLHLDLEFFVTRLYRCLHDAAMDPDIELGSSSTLHLPDPNADTQQSLRLKTRINIQTTTVLLIRSLSSVLLPTHAIRAVPPLRLAAFTKQCYLLSLQLPEKSAMALLSLLERVTKTHGRKVAGLWNSEERKGDGVFDAAARDVEGSNPYTATVWEGELLRRHYCPRVREMARAVEGNVRKA